MDINQIGLLLAYQRTKRKISVGELCEGICSRGFLGHVENGERGCEKIVAEALLQRVGFASDQILYFLEKAETEWLMVKEQLLMAVTELKLEEIERFTEEYRRLTVRKSVLHNQFLILVQCILQWKLYLREEEKKERKLDFLEKDLQNAWCLTRENYDIEGDCPNVLSTFELLIKILYFHVQEEKGRKGEVLSAYQGMLYYIEKNMESVEKAKFYPKLAYQMLLLQEQEGTEEEQEELYQNCLNVMKEEGSMSYLLELSLWRQRFLVRKNESSAFTAEIKELENLIEVLQGLYCNYKKKPGDWFINQLFGKEEVFVLSEAIKNRRICFDMTQEKLAEGICEPITISRIENGISNCKRGRIGMLMDKLHLPGGAAVFSMQTGRVDTYDTVEEIKRLARFGRHEECQLLFNELKEKAMGDRYTEQFMLHKEATIEKEKKQIEGEVYWEKQKEALHKTLPNKKPGELKKWTFTRTEAMIVNAMAFGCKKIGKASEMVEWLQVLKEYYERQEFGWFHYVKGYELTLKNLATILDQTREYEIAIAYEDIAIRLALNSDKANVLWLTLYGRGWNMEQLWGRGLYKKEDSRFYLRAAVALGRIYAKESSLVFMENKWEKEYAN